MKSKGHRNKKIGFIIVGLLIMFIVSTFLIETINFNVQLLLMILLMILIYFLVIEAKIYGVIISIAVNLIGFIAIALITRFSAYHMNAVMAFQISTIISVLYLYSYVKKVDIIQEKLYKQSILDELTGIYNRRYFNIKLEEMKDQSTRHKERFALFLIDIDNFKLINDKYGHAFGDTVLRDFSMEIRYAFRSTDTFFRIGGDEFALLVTKYMDNSFDTVTKRIYNTMDQMNEKTNEMKEQFSISIGVAVFPDDAHTVDKIIECADYAMYEAKKYDDTKSILYRKDLQEQDN